METIDLNGIREWIQRELDRKDWGNKEWNAENERGYKEALRDFERILDDYSKYNGESSQGKFIVKPMPL